MAYGVIIQSQKKTIHYNIVHNFAKYWPIFKIYSQRIH